MLQRNAEIDRICFGYYNRNVRVYDWDTMKNRFTNCLLLGNGASIAIDRRFSYKLLYNEVVNCSVLNKELLRLFQHYDTQNFEFILRILLETHRVNEILNVDDNKTWQYYGELKNALIKTIRNIHPKYEEVKTHFGKIGSFMCRFNTILNLNYDLLVYWAILTFNKDNDQWFKDCFVYGEFDPYYEDYLRKPHGNAKNATLVFYPHGSLFLATEPFGGEVKLRRSDNDYLLDSVLAKWEKDDSIPLFISEGTSAEKLRAIRRNRYLDKVFDDELGRLHGSLAIYGWSFGDQDEHIIYALSKSGITEIAISVHKKDDNWEDYCDKVRAKILGYPRLKKCELSFFDAQSKGCWIY